jgi:predicted nucleic acid-binding Zn ribbon protein
MEGRAGPAGPGGGPRSRWHSPRADATVKVADSLAELARQLGTAPPDTLSTVFSRWPELVGESLAAHARPEKLDGEALVVSVDSPAWASHLRTLAPRVVGQLNTAIGSSEVSRIVIRVKVPKKAPDLDI